MQDAQIAPQAAAGSSRREPDSPEVNDALERLRGIGARYVDFWFTEPSGRAWRITLAAEKLDARSFAHGIVLDGRSIGGYWEGMIVLRPDPRGLYADPVASAPTAALFCDVDPGTPRETRLLDARGALRRAESAVQTRLSCEASIGLENEFFLLDGGLPVPEEELREFLRGVNGALARAGVRTDWFRIGPAEGQGRAQIHPDGPLKTADQAQLYKHVVRALAARAGWRAWFLGKPLGGPGGAAMLVHHALWKDGNNLFHDARCWALCSDLARQFAGGLLRHAPALMAFCAPSANAYRRLIPGQGAATDLVLSRSRPSAVCRVPAGSTGASPEARRVKFCSGDPSANPYLALSALLMAGLDGIESRLEPPVEAPSEGVIPHCLEEALAALEKDGAFLLKDGVFTEDMLAAWVAERWEKQVLPIRSRPHPWELKLEEPA